MKKLNGLLVILLTFLGFNAFANKIDANFYNNSEEIIINFPQPDIINIEDKINKSLKGDIRLEDILSDKPGDNSGWDL